MSSFALGEVDADTDLIGRGRKRRDNIDLPGSTAAEACSRLTVTVVNGSLRGDAWWTMLTTPLGGTKP